MTAAAGMLLLTGGRGRRFGGPKHGQPHPRGGTWGGHLVAVFRSVFPEGPVELLGEPLPEHPGLPVTADDGAGPAAALVAWARVERPQPRRWWLVACDQVRWTREALAAWHAEAERCDPGAERWVMARVDDHTQYLGGFLPGQRVRDLASLPGGSLRDLTRALPCELLTWPHECWQDVDTPEALEAWLGSRNTRP